MLNHSDRSRRGQGALWLLPVIVLVAVGAWFLISTWQENARLRAELAGGKPVGVPPAAPAPTPAATPRPAAADSGPGRTLSVEQKKAIQQVLASVEGDTKNSWIQVQAGDREANAFADQLAGVFRDAGWNVTASTITGMTLKPGIFFFEAEEESPLWVGTAREALKAGGLTAMEAGGYRAYYLEKKKENPKWVGVEIPEGQEFAIVIGPKPAS